MLFAIHLVDRDGAAELRARTIVEHRAYLALQAARIALAGPLLAEDHATMIGSLLVMDFDDRAAAEAWLRDEPLTRAGVYGTTTIHPFLSRWPQRVGIVAA